MSNIPKQAIFYFAFLLSFSFNIVGVFLCYIFFNDFYLLMMLRSQFCNYNLLDNIFESLLMEDFTDKLLSDDLIENCSMSYVARIRLAISLPS